jgi:AcrR family transcriptional regulator
MDDKAGKGAPARPEGLRERKKRQTREAILDSAHRLFAKRGYHATTLSDIAAAADVSVSTVFGYFGTKEDILFNGFDAAMEDYIAWLERRDDSGSAIERSQRWWEERREAFGAVVDTQFLRLIYFDPDVNGARIARMANARKRLAAQIAKDLGDDPEDLRPRLVASAYVAMLGESARYRLEFMDDSEPFGTNPYSAYLTEFARAGLEAMPPMPRPAKPKKR